jgi:flagellar protein FliL
MSNLSASNDGFSPSIKETALAMLILTALGVGVGVMSVSLPLSTDEASAAPSSSTATARIKIIELPSIVTNLSTPSDTWVRFEGALVVDSRLEADVEALSGEINNDIIAYLRTLTLAQIEGPSGFQILRQALNERLAIRTRGKVGELAIRTLVVQ